MREIKFRAWNLSNSGMIEFDNEQAANDQYIAQHICLLMANKHPEGEGLLMQYTGLKDKNGKDIYEGDVLKVVSDDDPENPFSHEVKFNNCGYWIEISGYEYDITSLSGATEAHPYYEYEVVGNIYENPELVVDNE